MFTKVPTPFDEAVAAVYERVVGSMPETRKSSPFDMFADFKDLSEETCGAVVGALTEKIVSLHGRQLELEAVQRNIEMQYGNLRTALQNTVASRALCEAALKKIMADGEFVKPLKPVINERLTDGE